MTNIMNLNRMKVSLPVDGSSMPSALHQGTLTSNLNIAVARLNFIIYRAIKLEQPKGSRWLQQVQCRTQYHGLSQMFNSGAKFPASTALWAKKASL